MTHIILRLAAVKHQSGLSRSTIYSRISQGLWPKPISLGPRMIGWTESEVTAMNSARIAGKSEAEIRELVTKIEASRKTAA